MDKKKIGVAVGCAAVAAVIAICAVTFGGKKGDTAEPAATVETAATAEPTSTPEVTATPAPTEAPTATPEPTAEPIATPEPTAAPTPVVTAAPQPVVTAAPQPAQQEPSSDDGGEVPDWVDTSDTPLVSDEEYQAGMDEMAGFEFEG